MVEFSRMRQQFKLRSHSQKVSEMVSKNVYTSVESSRIKLRATYSFTRYIDCSIRWFSVSLLWIVGLLILRLCIMFFASDEATLAKTWLFSPLLSSAHASTLSYSFEQSNASQQEQVLSQQEQVSFQQKQVSSQQEQVSSQQEYATNQSHLEQHAVRSPNLASLNQSYFRQDPHKQLLANNTRTAIDLSVTPANTTLNAENSSAHRLNIVSSSNSNKSVAHFSINQQDAVSSTKDISKDKQTAVQDLHEYQQDMVVQDNSAQKRYMPANNEQKRYVHANTEQDTYISIGQKVPQNKSINEFTNHSVPAITQGKSASQGIAIQSSQQSQSLVQAKQSMLNTLPSTLVDENKLRQQSALAAAKVEQAEQSANNYVDLFMRSAFSLVLIWRLFALYTIYHAGQGVVINFKKRLITIYHDWQVENILMTEVEHIDVVEPAETTLSRKHLQRLLPAVGLEGIRITYVQSRDDEDESQVQLRYALIKGYNKAQLQKIFDILNQIY